MSKGRRKNDFYLTPARATEVLLDYCPEILQHGGILEPCAGQADISNVLKRYVRVATADIDPLMPVQWTADARTYKHVTDSGLTVVTNPPFLHAMAIVRNFVEQCKKPCAFLLRLSFLEPTDDRGPWLAERPPEQVIVLPRISFTGDGKTDSVTCAWMCWNVEPKPLVVVPKEKFYAAN